VLLTACTDPSWAVREAAGYGLAFANSPGSEEVLITLTRDPSWKVRAAAGRSLRVLVTRGVAPRERAIATLLFQTGDEDRDVRLGALRELGHLQADEARAAFLAGMRGNDEEIHDLCFKALTDLKEAREDLILAMEEALESSDEGEFLEAAEKYVELTGPLILENEFHLARLLRLLREKTLRTSKVFREIGRPAVPILLEDLRRFYSPGRKFAAGDYGPRMLDLVQEILAEDAAPIFEEILLEWEEADSARRQAVDLGSRYHAKTLVKTFKKAYHGESFSDIRSALLKGIAAADDPALAEFIRDALTSGNYHLKRTARAIIDQHPALEVGDALVKAAEDELVTVAGDGRGNPELAAVLVRMLVVREHPKALRLAQALLAHADPDFRRTGAGTIRFLSDTALALTLLSQAYRREDGRHWEDDAPGRDKEDAPEDDPERFRSPRRKVVQALLKSARLVGGRQALPLISQAATDGDSVVREAAMLQAAAIVDPASLMLALRLIAGETDPVAAGKALRVVVGYDDEKGQALLTRWLTRGDRRQRIDVLSALRWSESAHIPPAVIEALTAGGWDEDARLIAVEALENRGDPAYLPVLVKLVQQDPSLEVRSAAIRALGATGDQAAVPVLLELLDTGQTFEGDLAELQSTAVEVLGELGATRAVPRLLALLTHEWTLALESPEEDSRHFHAADLLLTALARTGDERATYPLVSLLFSPTLHQSFVLLDQSPPRDQRSLIGSLIRALVRFPDDLLVPVGKRAIGDRMRSGDAYRIDEGYLIYVAGLLADPRSEEIRLPRPRRGLASLLYGLTLKTVPRSSFADLTALMHLSSGAAGRHDFETSRELAGRRLEIAELLDPTAFREEETTLRADFDFLSGMSLMLSGREEEGLIRYRAGKERDAEDPQILNLFAWYLADTGRHLDEALETAMAAGRRAPSDPFVIDTIGWTLHRLGQSRQAVRRLNLAVTLDRGDSERATGRQPDPILLYHLAAAWSRAGFPGNSATVLARAVAMNDTLAAYALSDPDFEAVKEAKLLTRAVEEGLRAIPR